MQSAVADAGSHMVDSHMVDMEHASEHHTSDNPIVSGPAFIAFPPFGSCVLQGTWRRPPHRWSQAVPTLNPYGGKQLKRSWR